MAHSTPQNRVTISVDVDDGSPSRSNTPSKARKKGGLMWVFLILGLGMCSYINNHPAGVWDARTLDPEHPHDFSYYLKCALAGSFACASHVVLTPLDVVKVNMQYDPTKYRTLFQSLRLIVSELGYGTDGLWKGANAMFVSYWKQGVIKFSMYEFLKDALMNHMGMEFSMAYTGLIWLLASAIAETYADLALCPCEMLKVKMQTAQPGTFPTDFIPALSRFYAERSENGFPFGSIEAVWSRQIPYTMAKFAVFERTVQLFYSVVFTLPKESYDRSTQLFVTLCSGFLTGLVAAFVSHVPDTLFSLRAKPQNAAKTYGTLIKEHGLFKLATSGLVMRMILAGCLTAIQWYTYDSLKTVFGLTTTATMFKK
eukprot:TRINITY_DN7513_c3_g1_i1.p1 TRINITY_DN7513_c3_g1~~TRINITY_DN7513_c3_g1_i1.p1  ORF type:complete len:369 (+),score=23.21 TRINITY_DN7513_c3_g1_i1:30-1136(+)